MLKKKKSNKGYNLQQFQEYLDKELKSEYGQEFSDFLFELQGHDPKKAYNLSCCGKPFVKMHENDKGLKANYLLKGRCKDRFCPHCSKLRSIDLNKRMRKFFKKVNLNDCLRFVTLTYKNVDDIKKFNFRKISSDMARFRRLLKSFGYDIFGGYRVLEITYNEKTGYHPHLHLLYFADLKQSELAIEKYNRFSKKNNIIQNYKEAFSIHDSTKGFIKYNVLNEIWKQSNHQKAYVTKPVRIKYGLGAGINYICKYVAKGIDTYSSGVMVSIYQATRSFRFAQKFGSVFKEFSSQNQDKYILMNSLTNNQLYFGWCEFSVDELADYYESNMCTLVCNSLIDFVLINNTECET
jgi:hypothetical protein